MPSLSSVLAKHFLDMDDGKTWLSYANLEVQQNYRWSFYKLHCIIKKYLYDVGAGTDLDIKNAVW